MTLHIWKHFTWCLAWTTSSNYSFRKCTYYMGAIILIGELDDALEKHRKRQLALLGYIAGEIFQRSAWLKLWMKDEQRLISGKAGLGIWGKRLQRRGGEREYGGMFRKWTQFQTAWSWNWTALAKARAGCRSRQGPTVIKPLSANAEWRTLLSYSDQFHFQSNCSLLEEFYTVSPLSLLFRLSIPTPMWTLHCDGALWGPKGHQCLRIGLTSHLQDQGTLL